MSLLVQDLALIQASLHKNFLSVWNYLSAAKMDVVLRRHAERGLVGFVLSITEEFH